MPLWFSVGICSFFYPWYTPLLVLIRLRSWQLRQGHLLPYLLPFLLKVMNWFHASRSAFCKNSQHSLAPLSTRESSLGIPPNSVLSIQELGLWISKSLVLIFNSGYLKLVSFLFLLGYFWAEAVLQPGSSHRPKDVSLKHMRSNRVFKILLGRRKIPKNKTFNSLFYPFFWCKLSFQIIR